MTYGHYETRKNKKMLVLATWNMSFNTYSVILLFTKLKLQQITIILLPFKKTQAKIVKSFCESILVSFKKLKIAQVRHYIRNYDRA